MYIDYFENKNDKKYVTFNFENFEVTNINKSESGFYVGPDLIFDIDYFLENIIKPFFTYTNNNDGTCIIGNYTFDVSETTKSIDIHHVQYTNMDFYVLKNHNYNYLNLFKTFLDLYKRIDNTSKFENTVTTVFNRMMDVNSSARISKYSDYNQYSNDKNIYLYLIDLKYCNGFKFSITNDGVNYLGLIEHEGEIYNNGSETIDLQYMKNTLDILTDIDSKMRLIVNQINKEIGYEIF